MAVLDSAGDGWSDKAEEGAGTDAYSRRNFPNTDDEKTNATSADPEGVPGS